MNSDRNTRVFLSWSGDASHSVAKRLSQWIEDMLHVVDPWVSSGGLQKGSMWFDELQRILGETRIGILCVTAENVKSPWLLFEAGALSKVAVRLSLTLVKGLRWFNRNL